jgi:hypothetical protein
VVEDQVGDWVIPARIFERAATAWGVAFSYDGPPACEASPPGAAVFCMVTPTEGMAWGLPRDWLGGTFTSGAGSILSPRVLGRDELVIQAVICHEIGNDLGVAEHGPGIKDCMATPINGAWWPPSPRG